MQPSEPSKHGNPIKLSFLGMIGGSIIVSLLLVTLSMYLYNLSGAAQLDLSLPGLQDQRLQAQQAKRYNDFGASGRLNQQALDQFDDMYRHQREDIGKDQTGLADKQITDEYLEIKVE